MEREKSAERGARSAEREEAVSSRSALRAPRVFLIGPRGSGKSTVARLLASRLGWEWMDADAELESRCGRSIREVFVAESEAGFRRHEAEVLSDLSRRNNAVVATGGGAVLGEDNRRRLKTGIVIFLTADPTTLWSRVSRDPVSEDRRPALLAGPADGLAEMTEVLRSREALYRECADLIVDTAERSPEDIVSIILSFLNPDS